MVGLARHAHRYASDRKAAVRFDEFHAKYLTAVAAPKFLLNLAKHRLADRAYTWLTVRLVVGRLACSPTGGARFGTDPLCVRVPRVCSPTRPTPTNAGVGPHVRDVDTAITAIALH